jgi:hypothetical protein
MTAAVGARNLPKVDAGVVCALLQARYYDGSKGEFLSEDPVFLGDPKQQVRIPPAETVLFGDRLPRKHVALRLALRSVDAGRGSGRG